MTNNYLRIITVLTVCFSVTLSQAAKPLPKAETTAGKKKPIILRFPSDIKRMSMEPIVDTSKYGDITKEYQLWKGKSERTNNSFSAYSINPESLVIKKYQEIEKISDAKEASKKKRAFYFDYIKFHRSPLNAWLFRDVQITKSMSLLKRQGGGQTPMYKKMKKFRALYAEQKNKFDRVSRKELEAMYDAELKGIGYTMSQGYTEMATEYYEKTRKFKEENKIDVIKIVSSWYGDESEFRMSSYRKILADLAIDFYTKHFPKEEKIIKSLQKASRLESRFQELLLVIENRQHQTKSQHHYSGIIVDKQNRPVPGVVISLSRFCAGNIKIMTTLNQPDGTFDFIVEEPSPYILQCHGATDINFFKIDLFTGKWYGRSIDIDKRKAAFAKMKKYRDQTKHYAILNMELIGITEKEQNEMQKKWLRTSKPEMILKRPHMRIVMEKEK